MLIKRFIVKAGFKFASELEKAKVKISDLGVPLENINYISSPKESGKGVKFAKSHKGNKYALRLLPVGLLLGLLGYLILKNREGEGVMETINNYSLSNFMITTLLTGFAFLILGYWFGKKRNLNTVSFTSGQGAYENITMGLNTSIDKVKAVKNILNSFETINLEVIDTKFETKPGMRV